MTSTIKKILVPVDLSIALPADVAENVVRHARCPVLPVRAAH